MRGDRRNNGEIPPYWFLLRSSCIAATFHSNILAISVWSASIIIFLYWKQVHLSLVQSDLSFYDQMSELEMAVRILILRVFFFKKCIIFQNIWPIQLRGSGRVLHLSCFSFVYIEWEPRMDFIVKYFSQKNLFVHGAAIFFSPGISQLVAFSFPHNTFSFEENCFFLSRSEWQIPAS